MATITKNANTYLFGLAMFVHEYFIRCAEDGSIFYYADTTRHSDYDATSGGADWSFLLGATDATGVDAYPHLAYVKLAGTNIASSQQYVMKQRNQNNGSGTVDLTTAGENISSDVVNMYISNPGKPTIKFTNKFFCNSDFGFTSGDTMTITAITLYGDHNDNLWSNAIHGIICNSENIAMPDRSRAIPAGDGTKLWSVDSLSYNLNFGDTVQINLSVSISIT